MKTNVKKYTIEVYEEDGQSIISRCNDGFAAIELLGLCEMTQNEEKLLDIAKVILDMNQDICAKLTGSLMLAVRGIDKRREAVDIDIICDCLCEKAHGYPNVPKEFKQIDVDGGKSQVEAIQFINSDGVKVEFMQSDEGTEFFNGVPCGNVDILIKAKENYVKNDKYQPSIEKHKLDLEYLFDNNPELNKKN